MAKRLEYDIVTDPSKGIAGLKQFSSAAKKAMKDVNESMDDTTTSAQKVAKAYSKLADQLEADLKGAAAAADALGQALGPEITSRADLGSIVADLNRMGLTFDEITADADALATSLKKLDSVQMSGPVKALGEMEGSTKRAASGVEEVGRSADSSKGALANMVGNSVQDFGALTGVAGSAGVAIGQMGEYIADAALEGEAFGKVLGSFAKVAGPIAALTAAFQIIQGFQESAAESAERTKASVEAWTSAMADGGDTATNMTQVLHEQGQVILDNARNFDTATKILTNLPIVGWFGDKDTEDITALFDAAALGIDSYTRAVVEQGAAEDKVRRAIDESNLSERDKEKLLTQLGDAIEDYNKASENRNRNEKIFASTIQSTNSILQRQLRQQNPLDFYRDKWNLLMKDLRDGKVDLAATADAVDFLAKALGIKPDEVISIALQEIIDKNNEFRQGLDDTTKALEQWGAQAEEDFQTVAAATADAQRAFDDLAEPFARMSRAGEAMEEAFSLGNVGIDTLGQITDINDAIRDLGKFISEEGVPNIFDPNAVDAGPFLDKITALRDPIQRKIVETFAASGPEAAKQTADAYVTQITKSLKGRLTKDQVRTLLGLDDMEAKIKVAIDQESLKTATAMLELIAGFPGADPLWVAQVRLDLDAGKITPDAVKVLVADKAKGAGLNVPTELLPPTSQSMTAARQSADEFYRRNPAAMGTKTTAPTNMGQTLNDAQRVLNQHPLTVTLRAQLQRFANSLLDAGGTAGPGGGIVAERRPEIVNGRWLAVQPTVVPPGTRVTSGARTARILRTRGTRGLRNYDRGGVVAGPQTVNIHMSAGVIGNRYDVARGVRKAIYDNRRLLGTRG